jgi:hypothetical protein
MRIGERPPDYYFELLSGGPALQSAPRRPIAVDSKLHPPHHHTTAHVWVCTCTVVVGTAFLLPGCLAASDHRRRPVFPVVLCLPCLARLAPSVWCCYKPCKRPQASPSPSLSPPRRIAPPARPPSRRLARISMAATACVCVCKRQCAGHAPWVQQRQLGPIRFAERRTAPSH